MKYAWLFFVLALLAIGAVSLSVYRSDMLPVACTTRGCISLQAWEQANRIQKHFARAAGESAPSRERVLTTLIRQHLVAHALVKSPVTLTDARKYREDVLNMHDAATIEKLTGLTPPQYDQQIILPYLQEEAVRQDRRSETLDELFKQLSRDRWIIILPLHLWWNTDKAEVVRR